MELPAAASFHAGSGFMTRQRPTQPHSFENEKLARAYVETYLKVHFWLVPEVQLTHWSGKRLKIDYIAIPRSANFRAPILGIEVKRGYGAFKDFSAVLRQSIDYRGSTICDKRSTRFQGVRLPYVFVFPAIASIDGPSLTSVYQSWMKGAIRLAGQFNVGVIDDQTFWLSGHPWWSMDTGHHGLDSWWTANKVGSK